MFDTNPPIWLMPSFMQRVNFNMIRENKREIVGILRDFRSIVSEDRERINEIMRRGVKGVEGG